MAPDERQRITGIGPGHYDVKLQDQTGRECVMRDIEIKAGTIFKIAELNLNECR